jgi:Cu(I)/Ag(I) efflux system membrane fusion protein
VPAEALVDTGQSQYVFVAEGAGRFEPRTVRAGASDGSQVQILEGLAEDEVVVTSGNFLLDSESRLRAQASGERSPPARAEAMRQP